MSTMSPASARILEWSTTALLDRDAEILSGERADFQQRTSAMMAMWQPVPPLMILGFADRLAQWIEYFRKYEPDAERLAGVGRPAVRQRLYTMVDELRREVPIYQQAAGQGAARQQAPTTAASDSEAARKLRETRAETEKIMSDTRAADAAAGAKRQDMYTDALLGRCPNCRGTGRIGYAFCARCYGSGRL
jgi:hypothetical protein